MDRASTCGIRPSLVLEAAARDELRGVPPRAWGVECPGQNFVYADVDGTIGYQCTRTVPGAARAATAPRPFPGWTDEHEWDGWIPFEELPWAVDPARGYLVTANNRIHDDDYPHLIGHDFHTPYRARRIVERLEASRRARRRVAWPRSRSTRCRSPPARRSRCCSSLEPHTRRGARGDRAASRRGTATWRRTPPRRRSSTSGRVTSRGASCEPRLGDELFRRYHAWREVFQCEVLPALLRDPRGWLDDDLLRAALVDALTSSASTWATDPPTWRWGALHRLRLVHPLGSLPGLEPLFTAADVELGGDEQTVMQGGFDGRDGYPAAVIASWRAVYDLADLDRSRRRAARRRVGQPRVRPLERPEPRSGAPASTTRCRSRGRRSRPPPSPRCACSPGNIGDHAEVPFAEPEQRREAALPARTHRRRRRAEAQPALVRAARAGLMGVGVLVIVLNYIWPDPAVHPRPDEPGRAASWAWG